MLADMEAEHERIDPALAAVREAFAAMSEHPCTDHRNALEIRLSAAQRGPAGAPGPRGAEALPMLQRTLSEEENRSFEKAVGKRYPLQDDPVPAPVGDGGASRPRPGTGCSRPPRPATACSCGCSAGATSAASAAPSATSDAGHVPT